MKTARAGIPGLRAVQLNRALALVPIILFALVYLLARGGAVVNTSPSIGVGLWWQVSRAPVVGEYVEVCPPAVAIMFEAVERGYFWRGECEAGHIPLLKRIVAMSGDTIDIDGAGVRVNGELLPHSAPLVADRAGRLLGAYERSHFVLNESEAFLYGDGTARSFDSRYWGPVPVASIKSVITPLVIF